jgi:hypothetical protein
LASGAVEVDDVVARERRADDLAKPHVRQGRQVMGVFKGRAERCSANIDKELDVGNVGAATSIVIRHQQVVDVTCSETKRNERSSVTRNCGPLYVAGCLVNKHVC